MRGFITRPLGQVLVAAAIALGAGGVYVVNTTGGGTVGCTGADVTTSTFAARFSAAAAGDVLCLSQTASYGNFSGGAKTSPGVTIKAKPGAGVTPAMTFNLAAGDTWLTLDGVKITGGDSTICGGANNITVKNAEVANQVLVAGGAGSGACSSAPDFNNSAITFGPGLTWTMADDPSGATLANEGRLAIIRGNDGSTPSGILITGSTFNDNCADGIQSNAGGWTVTDSQFINLEQPGCAPHVDAIQWYRGAGGTYRNVSISNSYFFNDQTGIVDYDSHGVDITITNSAFDTIPPSNGAGAPCAAVCICGSTGTTVTHAVFVDAHMNNCQNHTPTPSTNSVLRDSILDGPPLSQGSSTFATLNYNFCTSGTCSGANSLNGAPGPTWVGGSSPTSFAGFALASGSRGENAASDLTDIGANP